MLWKCLKSTYGEGVPRSPFTWADRSRNVRGRSRSGIPLGRSARSTPGRCADHAGEPDNCRASDARARSSPAPRSMTEPPARCTTRHRHHPVVSIERSEHDRRPQARTTAWRPTSMEVCTCRRGSSSPWPAWQLSCCPAAPALPGSEPHVVRGVARLRMWRHPPDGIQAGLPRSSLASRTAEGTRQWPGESGSTSTSLA